MRPKDWRPIELSSNPRNENLPMPSPVRRRSPSPRPAQRVSSKQRFGTNDHSAHEPRQIMVKSKRVTHDRKAFGQRVVEIPNQHHVTQHLNLDVTPKLRQRPQKNKRHGHPNQFSNRRNQIQSGKLIQGNLKRQSGQRRKPNRRRISQENAESPLPVVVNSAPQPKYVYPNSPRRRSPAAVLNSSQQVKNAYSTIPRGIAKNPNENKQCNNNPNPNRTPSPRSGRKDGVICGNPNPYLQSRNSYLQIPKSTYTVTSDDVEREMADNEQADADSGHPGKNLQTRPVMATKQHFNLMNDKMTKRKGKNSKWISRPKMNRARRRRALDSPPGTPPNETTSSSETCPESCDDACCNNKARARLLNQAQCGRRKWETAFKTSCGKQGGWSNW